MSLRRLVLSLGLGLALALLSTLPAAAGAPLPPAAPQPAPAWLAADPCATPAAEQSLEVSLFASSQPLSTHPSCPSGQIYDPVCMVCHTRCPGGYFWDNSVCACQPI